MPAVVNGRAATSTVTAAAPANPANAGSAAACNAAGQSCREVRVASKPYSPRRRSLVMIEFLTGRRAAQRL